MSEDWHPLGPISELREQTLAQFSVGRVRIALSCVDGEFSAVSGVCNHAGGPLGEGRLAGELQGAKTERGGRKGAHAPRRLTLSSCRAPSPGAP